MRYFLITYTGISSNRNFSGNLTMSIEKRFPSYSEICELIELPNEGIIIQNIFEFQSKQDYLDYSKTPNTIKLEYSEFESIVEKKIMTHFNFTNGMAKNILREKNLFAKYNEGSTVDEAFDDIFKLKKTTV